MSQTASAPRVEDILPRGYVATDNDDVDETWELEPPPRRSLLDQVSLAVASAAAFLIGFGVYPGLVYITLALSMVAAALRIRNFRLNRWNVAFLGLLFVAYGWYWVSFVVPEGSPPGMAQPPIRFYGIIVCYIVFGFLLAATAGSQRAAIRIVLLISLGLLAKATMILVTTALMVPPPYYNTGGYDPIGTQWINPNNINDMAVYATWSLIAFVLLSRRAFSIPDYLAGTLLFLWSLLVGVAFGGRTFIVITIAALVAMAVRTKGLFRRWPLLLLGLVALVAVNVAAFAFIDFYRAGIEKLALRIGQQGLNSLRVLIYQSWFEQVLADPSRRPTVDSSIYNTWWFHNLWMDTHRTSGFVAMLLMSALWVLPFVRTIHSLRRGVEGAWPVLVALSCTTFLAAVSVAIEGTNYGGLAYFAALSALALCLGEPKQPRPGSFMHRTQTLVRSVTQQQQARRYGANTMWMLSEQTLRLAVGLLLGVYVARYLEPEGYGLYSYAVALAGIFAALARLGLDAVVVRDLVVDRERQREIVGAAFWLKVLGGVGAALLILILLPLTSGGDPLTVAAVVIVGLGIIFHAFDVADMFFQAEVKSKYASICKTVQLAISVVVRVWLIYVGADVIWFAVAVFIDQVALAAAYTVAMARQRILPALATYSEDTAAKLLRSSWPLIISGVAILLYMRIDQVMINAMLGTAEVGSYAAAVRIAEVLYFAPMAIAASVFPWLVAARGKGEAEFRAATLALLDVMTLLGLAVAIPLFLLSDWIVLFLFGPAFADAGAVLKISAWAGIFVFSGVVAQQWVVTRDQTWQSMIRAVAGAVCNIALNFVLIPTMGITGAAVATLVSQALASIVLNAAFPSARPVFFLQLRSLVMPGVHLAAYLRSHTAPSLAPVPADTGLEPTPW